MDTGHQDINIKLSPRAFIIDFPCFLQVRMLSEESLLRHQRRSRKASEGQLQEAWSQFANGEIDGMGLLRVVWRMKRLPQWFPTSLTTKHGCWCQFSLTLSPCPHYFNWWMLGHLDTNPSSNVVSCHKSDKIINNQSQKVKKCLCTTHHSIPAVMFGISSTCINSLYLIVCVVFVTWSLMPVLVSKPF